MSTINEWTDDLIGQEAEYKGDRIILIDKWAGEKYAYARSRDQRNGLIIVPLEDCEITHRHADAILCPLIRRADQICERVKAMAADLDHALCQSIYDETPPEEREYGYELTNRCAERLAEQANELARLADSYSDECA